MKTLTILLFVILPMLIGCSKKVGPTTVQVKDSVRHYAPIIKGEKIKMIFAINNTGKYPLVINDVQPSCGCIINENEGQSIVIPPGAKQDISFTFDSEANWGFVNHTIRLYANVLPHGEIDLQFSTHVISPDNGIPEDYETTYERRVREDNKLKEHLEDRESQVEYYTNQSDVEENF